MPTSSEGVAAYPGRAVAVALALGIGGPVLAFVCSLPVVLLLEVVALPVLVVLALLLVAGQYVAFGGLALGYLRFRDMDWAEIRSYLGVRVPTLREVGVVLGGWLVIFAAIVAISIVVQLVGAQPAENQAGQVAEEIPALIPPLIVAMFLVVGPSEELLYRGVVQGRLRESFGPAAAIVMASAIFAAIHWAALTGGAVGRLTTIAILFVPSLVFGAVYEYTGNLVVPALLHGLHNAVVLAILYAGLVLAEEGGAAVVAGVAVGALPL